VTETQIRRAGVGDLAVVQSISADAYRRYDAEIGLLPLPAREDYRPRIERGQVWILETEGECLGVAVVETRPDHLLLYSIAVRPQRQREGHGRRLLAFVDQHAAAEGLCEVRLFTNALMHRNVDIYRRWGFAEFGRRPHPSREGHVLVDMAKSVGDDCPTP
jgi:N-acetylglutamate synthase-like GNAT family acetyltransferase